jgi:hypothetical protein
MSKKMKYELEIMKKTSPKVLYNMIATPDGLSDWFADNVSTDKDNVFTFVWDGDEEKARLLFSKSGEVIRLQWLEDEKNQLETYFELQMSPVPSDPKMCLLTITDFSEESEMEESVMFWENQINDLKRILGS